LDDGADFTFDNLLRGLNLPVLSEDATLIYEAWVYRDGFKRPLSLGKFRNSFYRDFSNPYIDNKYSPQFPGEDFLMNAPSGFDFPLSLVGLTGDSTSVYITMEPYPDPFPKEPFPLVLLSRNLPLRDNVDVDPNTLTHNLYTLGNRYTELPQIEVTRTAATK